MTTTAARASGGGRRALRAAFSLPELMIALGILGLGLLIIAAALPVGLVYNRESIDRNTGDVAADYAAGLIEQSLRTSRKFVRWDTSLNRLLLPTDRRLDPIFRPRSVFNPTGDPSLGPPYPEDQSPTADASDVFPFRQHYEPIVKVRPLIMMNMDTDVAPSNNAVSEPDDGEELIADWLQWVYNGLDLDRREVDFRFGDSGFGFSPEGPALWWFPAMPVQARVFPAIPPTVLPGESRTLRFTPENPPPLYSALRSDDPWAAARTGELVKLRQQRFSWVAFYRRVAYDVPDPTAPAGGEYASANAVRTDPLSYEVITLVCRRPSEAHVFVRQDRSNSLTARIANPRPLPPNVLGMAGSGEHRLAPVPWLVTFTQLPQYSPGGALPPSAMAGGYVADPDRLANPNAPRPANLVFKCSPGVSEILPVGSIFIPAVNDHFPNRGAIVATVGLGTQANQTRAAGFVPHSPTALPIFRVKERPDDQTVIVENEGLYPWVNPTISPANQPEHWPVWVIPPAATLEGSTTVFENRSSVVGVSRRFVRLPEIAP
ncbi:MAG: prepilin-type N-terminal cleavage/methylation domain-containing protein [Phycisphaerae bacterium]